MMKYIIFIFSLIILISGCRKENLETLVVKTRGIGCSQCTKTIKNAVYSLAGVKEVNVDQDKQTVEVKYVEMQTNVETIEITITRAGYDANGRVRDPEGYDNLPECCKNHN